MNEKTELYYIHETETHFVFQVYVGEGSNKQPIGFTKMSKMPLKEVANLLPDQYTYLCCDSSTQTIITEEDK